MKNEKKSQTPSTDEISSNNQQKSRYDQQKNSNMSQIQEFSVTQKSDLIDANPLKITTLKQDGGFNDKDMKNDDLNIINNITNNYTYLSKQIKANEPTKEIQKQ